MGILVKEHELLPQSALERPSRSGPLEERQLWQWYLPGFLRTTRLAFAANPPPREPDKPPPEFYNIPLPSRVAHWRIGLIQNVLYLKVEATWGDRRRRETILEWDSTIRGTQPLLDSSAIDNQPYYGDPIEERTPQLSGIAGRVRAQFRQEFGRPYEGEVYEVSRYEPVVDVIAYPMGGFSRLIDPFPAQGIPPGSSADWLLSFVDRPLMSVPMYRNRLPLSFALYVIVLRSWLVVDVGGGPVFLNNSEPVTLWGFIHTEASFLTRTIRTQEVTDFYSTGVPGILKNPPENSSAARRLRQRSRTIRLRPGEGRPRAVLTGLTANEYLEAQLRPYEVAIQRTRSQP